MRLNRTTEEFVRHHRLLVERTENDPSNAAKALDKFPELEISIERLQEIGHAVETHRYSAKRRFIVQAHPEFQRAVSDFRSRWSSAHDVVRNRKYIQAALQISGEFLRSYGLLIARTSNDPAMVESLRKQQPDLADAIWRLDETIYALDNPDDYGEQEKYGSELEVSQFIAKAREVGRFTAQVPPKFREALADFRLRWADACALKTVVALSIEELFDAIEVVEPLDSDADLEKASAFAGNWLGKLLDSLPCLPMAEERSDDATEPRPFDPSRDSVDEAIWWLVDIFGKDPLFVENFGYSADEPLTWINETVGLNLGEIERRWLEFPVIVVPQHVSDRYGLDEPHGLYGLLTQVRLAYMSGANLAAIALCRSVTELLIRYHYASDIPNATISKGKGRTGLEWLIQQVQQRKEI